MEKLVSKPIVFWSPDAMGPVFQILLSITSRKTISKFEIIATSLRP